jgi:hypothetical protein
VSPIFDLLFLPFFLRSLVHMVVRFLIGEYSSVPFLLYTTTKIVCSVGW